MMLTLLCKNGSWADSGELEVFCKDTAGSMDNHAAVNAGFVARKALLTRAAVGVAIPVVSVAFRPYLGAFQQTKIIPGRTKLTLRLERASDNFTLIHNNVAGNAVTITRAQWHVRRVELTDSASEAMSRPLLKEHARPLQHRPCLVPPTDVPLSDGRSRADSLRGYPNACRRRVRLFRSCARDGTLNPLIFQNFGLRRLQIRAAGHNFPRQEYTPGFHENGLTVSQVSREYQSLMAMAHKSYGPDRLMFGMMDFCGGYALYGFDLTPDLDHGHWSPSYR